MHMIVRIIIYWINKSLIFENLYPLKKIIKLCEVRKVTPLIKMCSKEGNFDLLASSSSRKLNVP